MITYLLPTRDRPKRLRQTLDAIGLLSAEAHQPIGGAEVIVIDNASAEPLDLPRTLSNGWPLRILHRPTNEGAAARNAGVEDARGEWIIMLDDDSHPLDCNHIEVLLDAADDVAAIGAEILLPNGAREAGGLPEVIIGCGAAIRRDPFLTVGGYDSTFDYYAEEYDLCAKLLLNGWRIVHDRRFRVLHEKATQGRDMNRIVHRLVRNNCWVMQRYAPDDQRGQMLRETVVRYAMIAMKESAAAGFAAGMNDLLQSLQQQPRRAMSQELFDRFTGIAHVRTTLESCAEERFALVDQGKNAWAIRQALMEVGASVSEDQEQAKALMIGTLSPGPMLDALERRRGSAKPVIAPWMLSGPLTSNASANHLHEMRKVVQTTSR